MAGRSSPTRHLHILLDVVDHTPDHVQLVDAQPAGDVFAYLLIPLAFGFGAPLVPLVGTNVGAKREGRAKRIAFAGAVLGFVAAETVGLLRAAFPAACLKLFGSDPGMIAAGSSYLAIVGPTFGFFDFGMALYFASQGGRSSRMAARRHRVAHDHCRRRSRRDRLDWWTPLDCLRCYSSDDVQAS